MTHILVLDGIGFSDKMLLHVPTFQRGWNVRGACSYSAVLVGTFQRCAAHLYESHSFQKYWLLFQSLNAKDISSRRPTMPKGHAKS